MDKNIEMYVMFHANYGNPLRNHGHLKQGGILSCNEMEYHQNASKLVIGRLAKRTVLLGVLSSGKTKLTYGLRRKITRRQISDEKVRSGRTSLVV